MNMNTPHRSVRIATLLAVVLLLLPRLAGAQQMDTLGPLPEDGEWRLAGTFNNWHTDDDDYRLTLQPDGTLTLQRSFPLGEHQFKFVRGGNWHGVHAGCRGDDLHALEQPGNNIPLHVEHSAPLLIVIDPAKRTWRMDVAAGDSAVPIVRIESPALAGRPVLLDLSRSLARDGQQILDSRVAGPAHVTVKRGESPLRWSVQGPHAETVELRVAVSDGDWSDPQPYRLALAASYQLNLDHSGEMLALQPTPFGTHAGVTDPLAAGTRMLIVRDQNFRKLAMQPFEAHAGEQFAVHYHPKLQRIEVVPGSFATDVDAQMRLEIRELSQPPVHDPRRWDHLRTIAAQPPLADVYIFTACEGQRPMLRLPGTQGAGAAHVPMQPERTERGVRWHARVLFDSPTPTYDTVVMHSDGSETSARHQARLEPLVETPDWAKGATWYQVFPERFDNGDSENDPRGIGTYLKEWRSDFYQVSPHEFEAWQARVRWAGDDPDRWDRAKVGVGPADGPGRNRLYNVIWDRRYGGDLQGVINRLDHLESLGVDAIYLNPVFEAASMHKYDTTDYRHIDDAFGPIDRALDDEVLPRETLDPDTWGFTAADRFFVGTFLPACRERGIRVIIDGVFNHVGREFWAFQHVREHGTDSPYADWFKGAEFNADGELIAWAAWDGPSGWLPDFKQTAEGDLVAPVKQHIFDITARWLDPNGDGDPSDGVDGWRLDVPEMIGDQFWIDWTTHVKSINPDAYIVAEIWYDASRWLGGDMYDAQMHYPFGSAVVEWIGVKPGMTTDELYLRLDSAFGNDAPATQLVQQNLFDSHDTDRLVSQLFNPGRAFDAANRPQDNGPNYRATRPPDKCFRLARLAVAFQATYLGAPMIWQGDELGMWGADDPANRKPLTWPGYMPFESDAEQFLQDHLAHYQHWFDLRERHAALRYGSVTHLQTGSPRVAAFLRRLNDETLLVVLNATDEPYPVDPAILPDPGAALQALLVQSQDEHRLAPYHAGVWRVVSE